MILIAVALFAVLSYAVTSSSRGSGKNVSDEKIDMGLSGLVQYSALLKSSADRLALRGCDRTKITYEGATVRGSASTTTYVNSLASTTDKNCWVFSPQGAGLVYQEASEDVLDHSFSGQTGYRSVLIERNTSISGPGSWALYAIVPFVSDKACLRINKKYNTLNAPPVSASAWSFSPFKGVFYPGGNFTCTGGPGPGANACGTLEGCFSVTGITILGASSGKANIYYNKIMSAP